MRTLRVQLHAVLVLFSIISIFILSWVALSSYKKDIISHELGSIEKQSKELIRVLEEIEYFSTNEVVQSPWELSNCLVLMQCLYDERILLIKGEEILHDTDTAQLTDVISNTVKSHIDDILDNEQKQLLLASYEQKNPVSIHRGGMLCVSIPIYKENISYKETGYVYVMANTKEVLQKYYDTRERLLNITLILFAIILVVAFFYSGIVVKPLRELITYIERITEGFLNEKVSIKSYTEIEDVVDTINHMTTKLETLESSRQEFVSNVSHELKTPITSIKVLADSLLQQEDAPAELYREFLTDINEEIERENKIITDLLSLVKLDKTSGELNISNVNINELLEQILKRIKPIAAKRNIDLIFESFRPVIAEVDEVKFSLAVNNLIENAVKYNYDDGWVRVSLNADHKFFYVKVSDSGVGIPEDEQENVFERFYRVDKARSRETGGTGLGLSITRNAILMHRGALKVYSKEKEGTTFTVRIPLNYIKKSEM